ncbi:protein YgfX [Shewanella sp.]|uniref:protein YgfX n=1 Tax=Shewanella sp. TaxID=50422 RepID=UPI004054613A
MHYSFSFKSSRLQQGSLLGFAGLCLASLWCWPRVDSSVYLGINILTGLVMLSVFAYQAYVLSQWGWELRLNSRGEGELKRILAVDSQSFIQDKPAIVTPIMCVLFLTLASDSVNSENTPKSRTLMIFVDMLNDTDYRHLCRLLSQPFNPNA